MPILDTYRHYFNINPDYFPVVNEAVINENPDMWQKYYPHETFIKLIDTTIKVINRQQKLSIWVEGAYGTGKSHAVLTLQKLLEVSEDETKNYFSKFNLSNDLLNKMQGIKNNGKILTVHRYGASSIRNDNNLITAIQESIENALETNGFTNTGKGVLKHSIIKWLSDEYNKDFFNSLITGKFANIFAGDNVDDVISNLNTFSGEALIQLINNIFIVADDRNLKALHLDTKDLANWIKEIIQANELKAILFIWDEFTEYIKNNTKNLTGFQELVEISETDPFYLMIVTHTSSGLFSDTDRDKSKILDRFVKPTCQIMLPENMAFQLMGAAMEKSNDITVQNDWGNIVEDLYYRTNDSRKLVQKSAKIEDKELKNIIPIHPYAALLLKYISSAFDSNQRSMFDFIKNDRGNEIKGFQWFIDNHGPGEQNPLLTVEMLWEFFYEKGKDFLAHDIRTILDSYARTSSKNLNDEEKRVLKAILLLEAISQRVGSAVELFLPTEKNINHAFEGSDMDSGAASRCAQKLVREEIVYSKPLGSGKSQYSALVNAGDMVALEKNKLSIDKKSTSLLIDEGDLSEAITLNGALKLRYNTQYVSAFDIDQKVKNIRHTATTNTNKIEVCISFAKDDMESATIEKKIGDALKKEENFIIFIDTSITPLGADGYEQYRENMAQSLYYQGKDNNLAKQYDNNAKEALIKWKKRITDNEFIVYTKENTQGIRIANIDFLYDYLKEANKRRFEHALETQFNVIENLYTAGNLKVGVKCGIEQKVEGTFKSSNNATKLENALDGAWEIEEYWKKQPYLLISKIKIHLDEFMTNAFNTTGKVSIKEIYNELKSEPFGFMPCNLTAFVLGFLLKEYVSGSYSCTDTITNDNLTVQKMQEIIEEVIKDQITPNTRYRDKFIVAMSEDEKLFIELTSIVFNIPSNQCSSIEQTRDRIRFSMKNLGFPIWTLKSLLNKATIQSTIQELEELLNYYCGIANNKNLSTSLSETEIAYKIGAIYKKNPCVANDLKGIFTKEHCTEGMKEYLKSFNDGELYKLALGIDDAGQYINAVREKFDADAANWVWNQATAEQKIQEVILDYKIILESNKIFPKNTNFKNTVAEWYNKSKLIRISYLCAKNSFGELEEFMKHWFSIARLEFMPDNDKEHFYSLLCKHKDEVRVFYENQINTFKSVCSFYLEDLNDDEISNIYSEIPSSFTKEKSEYLNLVKDKIEKHKRNSESTKLKVMWREKTKTETPQMWSKQYRMPILSMLPSEEFESAKEAFNTLNKNIPDEKSISKAIEYIKNASFFDSLDNKKARDQAFIATIIKEYDSILTDLEEVKEYLELRLDIEPYEWLSGHPEVNKKLKLLAEAKYNEQGCEKALEQIERMEPSDVKRYLKDLIKDNLSVGLAIIKNSN